HNAPTEAGDKQCAGERADGEACDNYSIEDSAPAAAGLRGEEFGHGGVACDEVGAESDAHYAAKENQRGHVGGERGGDRGEAAEDEVCLIGEAAAEAIAKEAGKKRAEHHADEGDGNELGVLREGGKAGMERGAEDAGGDVVGG